MNQPALDCHDLDALFGLEDNALAPTPERISAARRHLAACRRCEAQWADDLAIAEMAGKDAQPASAPPFRRPEVIRPRAAAALLGAAALMALAIRWWSGAFSPDSHPSPSPSPPPTSHRQFAALPAEPRPAATGRPIEVREQIVHERRLPGGGVITETTEIVRFRMPE